MGRSVSYATGSQVITFRHLEPTDDEHDFEAIVDDFRDHLRYLFPSTYDVDEWIGNEDHVLAENKLARFGISEYCGLVSYWIVPKETPHEWDYYGPFVAPLAKRWIASIADKFVAAFGELSQVGTMSNGGGVYRRIDN